MKDTYAAICPDSGIVVRKEQAMPNRPEMIPADLLVISFVPEGPLAIDFRKARSW